MKTIYVFLADGFEEIEALGTVDILRRAGLHVITVSVMGRELVESAHKVSVMSNGVFNSYSFEDADMLVLPGGMPGASNLKEHQGLGELLKKFAVAEKPLAAICAAPMVLGYLGLLKGKKATCYPGFETFLTGADYTGAMVEKDGEIITGKGPGATFLFALAIVKRFCGKEKVQELKEGMLIS